MRLAVLLGLFVCVVMTNPVVAQTMDGDPMDRDPYDDYSGDSCLGPDDPFCTTGGGGGGGEAGDCFVCEVGYMPGIGNAHVCVSVTTPGHTGRSVCDDGWFYTYCDLEGAFCEIISVTP